MTRAAFYRDANRVPIQGDGLRVKTSVTFAGGTTDAWGDDGGALDGGTLFEVTGLVKVRVYGVCNVDCTGAGSTNEVGITGATAIFMPITTMTDVDAGTIWINNATPASYFVIGEEEAAADNLPWYLLNGTDIIMTTKTANTTAGQVDFYCEFWPVSEDADVVGV